MLTFLRDDERAFVTEELLRGTCVVGSPQEIAAKLRDLESAEFRTPVIDGCEFREAMQAVHVEGGVAGNVVPDRAAVTINHRFAPDRTPEEAIAYARSVVEPFMEDGDTFEVTDMSPPARPDLRHPVMAAFIGRNDILVRAKLGWTDVAFFSEQGIPAVNFGPGDATLAHTQQEHLYERPLVMAYMALEELLTDDTALVWVETRSTCSTFCF